MDIQLDFPMHTSIDKPISLASLLRRFCADEKVGDVAKGYACSNCGGGEGAVSWLPSSRVINGEWWVERGADEQVGTKQLMVKKLPNVLSFQLKVCCPPDPLHQNYRVQGIRLTSVALRTRRYFEQNRNTSPIPL